MGYHTDFWGEVRLDPPLTEEQREYLWRFANTRRMKRDNLKLAQMTGLPPELADVAFGTDGEFYVGGEGFKGQESDDSVIDSNREPDTQPGLWCQWIPRNDGTAIEWDGGEKFYEYTEWMTYIMENFIKPWGIDANGTIDWDGEESDDRGRIVVEHCVVKEQYATITFQ